MAVQHIAKTLISTGLGAARAGGPERSMLRTDLAGQTELALESQ